MYIVITKDGTEVLIPETIRLDSNNIRQTVNLLIEEKQAYQKERQYKRAKYRQVNKKFFQWWK